MTITLLQVKNLSEFLKCPETKPASEYINGEIIQKPMPKGKHSRLELRLCNAINEQAEPDKMAYAFPELRCSFSDRSIVPDIAVFRWSNIPFEEDGEVPNDFLLPPDWIVEILSPEQSANQVMGKILYSLRSGSQLGWLVDPQDRSIVVFEPNKQPEWLTGSDRPQTLAGLELDLTIEQIFGWLKLN